MVCRVVLVVVGVATDLLFAMGVHWSVLVVVGENIVGGGGGVVSRLELRSFLCGG